MGDSIVDHLVLPVLEESGDEILGLAIYRSSGNPVFINIDDPKALKIASELETELVDSLCGVRLFARELIFKRLA